MTASNTLALFKTPVARDGFSSQDSASPARSNRRRSARPSLSANAEAINAPEDTLLLGLAVATVPAIVYSLLQLTGLIAGGTLDAAIRAFMF